MKDPIVCIVIPVFNGIEFTRQSLAGLFQLKAALGKPGQQLPIILVDDGSTDGTAQWVKENYPEVHLLSGDGNLWWSGGVNLGAAYALETLRADYVLWWNNDIIPREDYLQQLFKIISNTPSDVVIGSKIYSMHKNLVWGMGGKFDPVHGTRYMFGERMPDHEGLQQPLEVDWFPGMGTVIHRSVFQAIGFLDEKNFPQYHGDSDFTFRAKMSGFRLIAFPQLVIFNDNTNTGMFHNGSFSRLFQSLTSIKSIYGFRRDYRFLKTHATSYRAYGPFMKKYFYYIGGFLKWKVLNTIGIRKHANEV